MTSSDIYWLLWWAMLWAFSSFCVWMDYKRKREGLDR